VRERIDFSAGEDRRPNAIAIRSTPPLPHVKPLHSFHHAVTRGSSWRRNHLQCPNMDASSCQSGSRYRVDEGAIEVDSINPIGFRISLQSWLANRVSPVSSICSRLRNTVKGENICLVRFHQVRPRTKQPRQRKPASTRNTRTSALTLSAS